MKNVKNIIVRSIVLVVFVLVIMREAFFIDIVYAKVTLPEKSVIDMHAHIACIDKRNGCFIAKELRENYRYPIYVRSMGSSIEQLQQEGDHVIADHIDKQVGDSSYVSAAVVLALDGVISNGELNKEKTTVYVPNSYVLQQVKSHKHLLYGASINPYRKDALQRLEQAKEDGAVLIKWLPSIMGIDPSDKSIIPFYKKLVELQLPLLTHTGDEHSFTTADNSLGDPQRLELAARIGVTVIAAHIATTGETENQDNFTRLLPLMKKYPNLYADISSLTQINKLGYLKKAMQVEGLEKQLVYGSDWPLQFSPLVSAWYFPMQLTIAQMFQISRIENQWDRDVRLKQALAVPDEVFLRSRSLLLGK